MSAAAIKAITVGIQLISIFIPGTAPCIATVSVPSYWKYAKTKPIIAPAIPPPNLVANEPAE